MSNRVTIEISSMGGNAQSTQRVSFEAKGAFATSQVRAVLKRLKAIAPPYVSVRLENSEEITEIK